MRRYSWWPWPALGVVTWLLLAVVEFLVGTHQNGALRAANFTKGAYAFYIATLLYMIGKQEERIEYLSGMGPATLGQDATRGGKRRAPRGKTPYFVTVGH